jgi:uncharacterized protein (TIGR02268 family)
LLRTFLSPLALASLLVGFTSASQAAPRSVVLTGRADESTLIYLARGSVTGIFLSAPIVRESVEVEGRARFAVVDVGDQSISLVPAVQLRPDERLALRVTFREGFPSHAVFFLTGHTSEPDSMVSVSRPQQPVAACQVEVSATRERCEAQRREAEELSARPMSASPASVALAGLEHMEGVRGQEVKECRRVNGEFRAARCKVFAASTWAVVVLEVSNKGTEPWVPAWAVFTHLAGGESRRARTLLAMQAGIPPGGAAGVSVEVELPTREPGEWLRAPHSLRVCDAAGSRCLFLPVTAL